MPTGDKRVPCFSEIGKTRTGMPKIDITFPDGSNDTMDLGKFLGTDGVFIGKHYVPYYCNT